MALGRSSAAPVAASHGAMCFVVFSNDDGSRVGGRPECSAIYVNIASVSPFVPLSVRPLVRLFVCVSVHGPQLR